MGRKTWTFTIASTAAAVGMNVATAETSGAWAQSLDGLNFHTPDEDKADAEVAPIFVSKEVVQPLPEPTEEGVAEPEAPTAQSLRELVAMTPTEGELSEEMQCLAGAIYFEARGEPLAGQLAVGQVIINRAEDRRFPANYCGVVYQRKQFSFVRNGQMPRIRLHTDAWRRAKAIAKIAHNEHWESEAADSLYFHANYVKPRWASKKIARATINRHIFYK